MKERIKKYALPVLALVLSIVSALFWVALRINHSGISKFLGADTNPSFLIMNLPVMVTAAAWIGAGFALAGLLLWPEKKWPAVTGLVIGAVMAAAAVAVILFGAKDYLRFILPHFWESLAVTALIALFALVLFFPVTKGTKAVLALKAGTVVLAILAAVILGYQLRPCDFTYGAVVYAVEDDYQIVFSTSDSAVAWVEIGGECYYDLYAGSMRSVDRVHKVEVPQHVLDAAGGYTVCAQQMIYRGPFGGYKGKTISRSYDFRPVDASDGINYFALSDVHESVAAAAKTASAEDTDFIVLIGDLVSMVETEKDAQLANDLAHRITGGEMPVIYARGNHEVKGEYSEVLYKYVGSKNQEYYYWVTLGSDVYAVVLDMGEDHEDDWWEYYGTAQFDRYRAAQTDFLRQELEAGRFESYGYRIAVCHIPIPYVDKHGYFEQTRLDWTALLNDMDMDISLSGHKHVFWTLVPGMYESGRKLVFNEAYSGESGKVEGGYLPEFTFATFLVGRRSLQQAGGTLGDRTSYTCLHIGVNPDASEQIAHYVNSEGETVTMVYPFEGCDESYTELTLPLK